MVQKFREFLDKKGRETHKQLTLLMKLLEKEGMKVTDFREEEEPYIFLWSDHKDLSFDGVRIYRIGDTLAYRVQREDDTHPYGKAYSLDIEEMWNDLMGEQMSQKKATNKLVHGIVGEFKKFFERSSKAEEGLRSSEFQQSRDPLGQVMGRSTGTDYANTVHNNGRQYGTIPPS